MADGGGRDGDGVARGRAPPAAAAAEDVMGAGVGGPGLEPRNADEGPPRVGRTLMELGWRMTSNEEAQLLALGKMRTAPVGSETGRFLQGVQRTWNGAVVVAAEYTADIRGPALFPAESSEATVVRQRAFDTGRGGTAVTPGRPVGSAEHLELFGSSLPSLELGLGTSFVAPIYRLHCLQQWGPRFATVYQPGYFAAFGVAQHIRVVGGGPVFTGMWMREGADPAAWGRARVGSSYVDASTYSATVPPGIADEGPAGALFVLGVAMSPVGRRVHWHHTAAIRPALLTPPGPGQWATVCRWLLECLQKWVEVSEAAAALAAFIETVGMSVRVGDWDGAAANGAERDRLRPHAMYLTPLRRSARGVRRPVQQIAMRGAEDAYDGVLRGLGEEMRRGQMSREEWEGLEEGGYTLLLEAVRGDYARFDRVWAPSGTRDVLALAQVEGGVYALQVRGQRLPHAQDWQHVPRGGTDRLLVSGPSPAAWHFRTSTTLLREVRTAPTLVVHDKMWHWLAATLEVGLSFSRNGLGLYNSVTNLADWSLGADRTARWRAEPGWQRAIVTGVGGFHYAGDGTVAANARVVIGRRFEMADEPDARPPLCPPEVFPLAFAVELAGTRGFEWATGGGALGRTVYNPVVRADVVQVVGTQLLRRDSAPECGTYSVLAGNLVLQYAFAGGLGRPPPHASVATSPSYPGIAGGGYAYVRNAYVTRGPQDLVGFLDFRGPGDVDTAVLTDVEHLDVGWGAFRP